MRRDSGFTLIELMIAIALVAILLATAVPALEDFTNDARQTGAINDFVSAIHLARNTAITTNSRVTLCASASGAACQLTAWENGWIVFADLDASGGLDVGETVVSSSGPVEGLSIQSGEFPAALMYRPNGRAMTNALTGNAGEFAVCDFRGVEHAKVILVEISGRPRMSEKRANGMAPNCI
ncbi:MAG TPA: GspH/FimT family pseudopilin [Woeseiaceae bacterium]|nr:GspH/FimT family pseudopilin [Woeseiaceae bacterium]